MEWIRSFNRELRARPVAGDVYTQATSVEEEVNGLIDFETGEQQAPKELLSSREPGAYGPNHFPKLSGEDRRMMSSTRLHLLHEEQGQSPWLDNIRRGFLLAGGLHRLRELGIRGVTANPTIFERAVSAGADYDEALIRLAGTTTGPERVLEELLYEDIRTAADVLRPVYDESDGRDGYVSIEVNPKLARDTEGTVAEARKFWSTLDRPNIFIKVPATDAGIPAIRQLLGEGININITLIFALEYYERVMDAYIDGLEALAASGKPLDSIASVASFFVSRVDTEVDKRLGALIDAEPDEARRKELKGLLGQAAIANAKVAYQRFLRKFSGGRWEALASKGARVQRPLWASTSTKNPAYRDVIYVEELIGPDTVNTMPPATIEAFQDHGVMGRTLDRDVEAAYAALEQLESFGISMQDVTDKLLEEGIRLFSESIERLERAIEEKRRLLVPGIEQLETSHA